MRRASRGQRSEPAFSARWRMMALDSHSTEAAVHQHGHLGVRVHRAESRRQVLALAELDPDELHRRFQVPRQGADLSRVQGV